MYNIQRQERYQMMIYKIYYNFKLNERFSSQFNFEECSILFPQQMILTDWIENLLYKCLIWTFFLFKSYRIETYWTSTSMYEKVILGKPSRYWIIGYIIYSNCILFSEILFWLFWFYRDSFNESWQSTRIKRNLSYSSMDWLLVDY